MDFKFFYIKWKTPLMNQTLPSSVVDLTIQGMILYITKKILKIEQELKTAEI